MAHQEFTRTDLEELPGWAHLLVLSDSDLDDLAAEIQGTKGKTARIIRGARCQTRERLFQELAAALQFPHYFGENWDAVEECLGDLEWLDETQLTLLITHADRLLAHHEADLATFLSILQSVHDLEGSLLERVVVQCEETKTAEVSERFKQLLDAGGEGDGLT